MGQEKCNKRTKFLCQTLAKLRKKAQLCTRKRKDGGCSSAWLERQIVALEVAGSIPVTHPNSFNPLRLRSEGIFLFRAEHLGWIIVLGLSIFTRKKLTSPNCVNCSWGRSVFLLVKSFCRYSKHLPIVLHLLNQTLMMFTLSIISNANQHSPMPQMISKCMSIVPTLNLLNGSCGLPIPL